MTYGPDAWRRRAQTPANPGFRPLGEYPLGDLAPWASVPLATAFCLVFWAVLGSDYAPAFSAGFLAGYLAYDMVHYHVHHHRPRTRVGRRLRELHMRHHFQDDERGFGISAPYWDRVFGTMHVRRGR